MKALRPGRTVLAEVASACGSARDAPDGTSENASAPLTPIRPRRLRGLSVKGRGARRGTSVKRGRAQAASRRPLIIAAGSSRCTAAEPQAIFSARPSLRGHGNLPSGVGSTSWPRRRQRRPAAHLAHASPSHTRSARERAPGVRPAGRAHPRYEVSVTRPRPRRDARVCRPDRTGLADRRRRRG